MSIPGRRADSGHDSKLHHFGLSANAGELEEYIFWAINPLVVDFHLEPAGDVDLCQECDNFLESSQQLTIQAMIMAPLVTEQIGGSKPPAVTSSAHGENSQVFVHLATPDSLHNLIAVMLV